MVGMNKGSVWILVFVMAALTGSVLAKNPSHSGSKAALPRPAHVVLVMEENRTFKEILGPQGRASQPYLYRLAEEGADMVSSFAVGHKSELNYMALFSGKTYAEFDTAGDHCPVDVGKAPNLAASLLEAGLSFAGYSEGLPSVGSTACHSGKYARKHCPWANFQDDGNVPVTCNLPFTAFPRDFNQLPAMSWVIPNLDHDMHDGSPEVADAWLKKNLSAYADWCKDPANNSLLIIDWDEDDGEGTANQIPTIFYGAMIQPGQYPEPIDHYRVLRTLLDMYGLAPLGRTAKSPPITDIFKKKGQPD